MNAQIAASLNRALSDYFRAALDAAESASSLSMPERGMPDKRRREIVEVAEPLTPIPGIDTPLPVVLSFAERVDALAEATGDAIADPALHKEPENMVDVLYFDRAGGNGGRFVGHLFLDAATGKEVKLVTPGGRTVWL